MRGESVAVLLLLAQVAATSHATPYDDDNKIGTTSTTHEYDESFRDGGGGGAAIATILTFSDDMTSLHEACMMLLNFALVSTIAVVFLVGVVVGLWFFVTASKTKTTSIHPAEEASVS